MPAGTLVLFFTTTVSKAKLKQEIEWLLVGNIIRFLIILF